MQSSERVENVHAARAAAAVTGIALEADTDRPGTGRFGLHREAEVDDCAVALEAGRIKRGSGAAELEFAFGLAVEDMFIGQTGIPVKGFVRAFESCSLHRTDHEVPAT